MSEGNPFRCGFVAIVGRPNVGKSTLLNCMLGQKLSITSAKPQTTRHRILGIKTGADFQVAYVDTPGIHPGARRALNRYMNRAADGSLTDVDEVIMVVEAGRWTEEDTGVAVRLRPLTAPVILAINKVDRVKPKTALLPYIDDVAGRGEFSEIVPICARRGDNVERLEELVVAGLPVGEPLFPEDQFTDRSERFIAAEFVREKLMRRLGQELPYRLSVEVERFSEGDRLIEVNAIIWVERKGHKAIVIGEQGRLLKTVGSEARQDMQRMFGKKVLLKLWTKVKEGWSDDERALQRMGYRE